jgi:hypothetical protein
MAQMTYFIQFRPIKPQSYPESEKEQPVALINLGE